MKALNRSRKALLTAIAVILAMGTVIGSSLAYFTTYATANGNVQISLGSHTEIREKLDGLNKRVTIYNDEDSNDVYVRVKPVYGTMDGVIVTVSGKNWTAGENGWYYYNDILKPGDTISDQLNVDVKIENGVIAPEKFDIVVVHESKQVLGTYKDAVDAFSEGGAK